MGFIQMLLVWLGWQGVYRHPFPDMPSLTNSLEAK